MNDKPLISIVTPVYNGSDYIAELIESVRAQTYSNIEHIVIDDGSKDGGKTVSILEQYDHLRWWTRENKGQYATLNEGFRAATGDFVTTISHDDRYADSRVIEDIVAFALAHPDAEVIHGETVFIDSLGEKLPVQRHQRYPYWVLPYNPYIYHCSLFVRRQRMIEEQILFDPSFRFLGDADWMVRLYLRGLKHKRIDRKIAEYRFHQAQTTALSQRDRAVEQAKAKERAEFNRRYCRVPGLRRVALAWATYHRRRLILANAIEKKGLSGMFVAFSNWVKQRGRIGNS